MPRILIADDHVLVRDTLCAFLHAATSFDVRCAPDFPKAAMMLESEGPFDLVLLDYVMPGMNGLDGLAQARHANADQSVAILSGHPSPQVVRDTLDAGARGFVPKTLSADAFVNAVRLMLSGETYAPVELLTQPLGEARSPGGEVLTERERDVLLGLCRGLANKEIARELGLQEVTVKLHVKTLCRKLNARNRTHAAMLGKDAALV